MLYSRWCSSSDFCEAKSWTPPLISAVSFYRPPPKGNAIPPNRSLFGLYERTEIVPPASWALKLFFVFFASHPESVFSCRGLSFPRLTKSWLPAPDFSPLRLPHLSSYMAGSISSRNQPRPPPPPSESLRWCLLIPSCSEYRPPPPWSLSLSPLAIPPPSVDSFHLFYRDQAMGLPPLLI